MLHRGFKPAKCKTALNLAKSRIKLMKNKKDNQLKQLKREVAQLLESGQDQTARIRVEHVIREEKMIAAYEMIEIYCELIVVRLPIIESQKNCPLDLKEAIASLIFAAPRCGDIIELQDVRKHFTAKYGKEFATAAAEIRPACGVSRSLVEKLSVKAPDGQTKVKILTAIAEEHNIKWEPNWFNEDPEPSVDIPKIEVAQSVDGSNASKIQMQPLNFEIVDPEENQAHDKTRPGTSQSHAYTNSDFVPPSTSRPDFRPSESPSEKMISSQSFGTAESAFMEGRPKWNMEFKDATAAAQAAAESAEMASLAARAAAELANRSNIMSEDSHHPAGSGVQHDHVHRNSNSGSFNQRTPRILKQENTNRHGNMTEGGDAISLNKDYSQYGLQYETGKQDFTERVNSQRYSRDSDPSLITSIAEPNVVSSSNFQDYEIESSENPFYEETVERKNQSSSFQSQRGAFGDEYGAFANSNYGNYKHDSDYDSLDSFGGKAADQEDWHVESASFDEEDRTFNDHREGNRILESDNNYGFNAGSDFFLGTDHRASGTNFDENVVHTNAEVFFDESGSDDDKNVLNPPEEYNVSSPSGPSHMGSSLNQDNRHFDPDLSESFKKSPIYSKLTEPIPVAFDDSDEENLVAENKQQREKFDSGVCSYDYQKPDADQDLEVRSPYVDIRPADSFINSEHVEENESRYCSGCKNKYGYDNSGFSELSNEPSSAAVSTGFKSRPEYDLFDGGSQKSLQSSRVSESHPVYELESETKPTLEGGMGLNLGSLPGGRRNRVQGRLPRGRLADSKSTEAASSDTFGSSEKASTYEFHVSSNDNKELPAKMSGFHTHNDLPGEDAEVIYGRKDSDTAKGQFKATNTNDRNVRKIISPKDPTRYFGSDDSSSEEDVPKPVMSKTLLAAGLSRRTKALDPSSVASSRPSVIAEKTGRSSSSYNTDVSRIISQSSWDNSQNLATKSSKDDRSSSLPVPDKLETPKRPDVLEASTLNEKAPKENSIKNPSHVHPKLPDFETFTAHLQSLRKNRQ